MVTSSLAGIGRDAADCALVVRRCSIVKSGFWRQKLTAGAWGVVALGSRAACAATSNIAAWMPPMVVGR